MLNLSVTTRSVIEALESRIAPATFTVTTTADSGPGSLRQAILDANALEGADTIGFDIPGDQLQIIELISSLPAITDKITISAIQSSPLWASTSVFAELVRIDGTNAGEGATGLRAASSSANHSTFAGLQITNFSGSGMLIEGSVGVQIIRNHIFGNGEHGIHIIGGSANQVFGNILGSSTTVPESTGNEGNGLLIENSNANRITGTDGRFIYSGQLNLIQGNGLFGIEVRGGESNVLAMNEIKGNGSRATTVEHGGGIAILDAALTQVGTTIQSGNWSNNESYHKMIGNQLSANHGAGLLIKGQLSTGTIVAGNTVTQNIDGIRIDGAKDTTFGALESYSGSPRYFQKMIGNTISENAAWGISIANGASNTVIRTNVIEGNVAGGILFDHATGGRVGGTGVYGDPYYYPSRSTDSNTLLNGAGVGVVVKDSLGIEIVNNGFVGTGLPIDLGGNGATPNDLGDGDSGANALQNYPELVINRQNGQALITGSLTTDTPSTRFRIELYTKDATTGTLTFLTAQELVADANGMAPIQFQISETVLGTKELVAIATNLSTRNTSEFSPSLPNAPRVSVGSAIGKTLEGNTHGNSATFEITLTAAATVPVTVNYQTANGTATAGTDFVAVQGTVTFAPGEITKTVTVPLVGDTIQEQSENLYLDISAAEGALIGQSRGSFIIVNDDDLPVISIHSTSISEGLVPIMWPNLGTPATGGGMITLTMDRPSLDPVTVNIDFVGGTATYSTTGTTDFNGGTTTPVTFAPGQTSAEVRIWTVEDSLIEPDETIFLRLSSPTNGTLGQTEATVTIIDNDSWRLTTENVSLLEGDDGIHEALIPISLVPGNGNTSTREVPVTVFYRGVDSGRYGPPTAAGSDYDPQQFQITFAPGETTKIARIPIYGDEVPELSEVFGVTFSATNAVGTVSLVTILNDDIPAISVTGGSVVEGNGGAKALLFTVQLSQPALTVVSADYTTADGTATAGSDYTAVSGKVSFLIGEQTKLVYVPILVDTLQEGNETLRLFFSNASGVTIETPEVSGTILDDDAPLLSVTDATVVEGNSENSWLVFTFSLSTVGQLPVSVQYSTADNTAKAGSDYTASSGTLTFEPGDTTKMVAVPILGDTLQETDESLRLLLSGVSGATLLQTEVTGLILNDDIPLLSVSTASVVEGNSGTRSLVFNVLISQASLTTVSVQYSTADGDAIAGSDYIAASSTLIFNPGETAKTVTVPILGDILDEGSETLRLLLSGVSGATLLQAEVTGIVLDDDVSPDTVSFAISKGGRKATWIDSDGDRVTLTATKSILTPALFQFGTAIESGTTLLQQLDLSSINARGAVGLKFAVEKSATGDGVVNVGRIDASGHDLSEVRLSGRLGAIFAGDNKLSTPAIRKLTVNSFGVDPLAVDLEASALLSSEVKGTIGSFVVKQDLFGARLVVSGGGIRSVAIGGSLEGTSSVAPSGISVEKSLMSLKVGGDVVHANIIAGANSQARVQMDKVLVKGDWTASNLVAGAGRGADGFFGTEDDTALQSTASRIAKITIRGTVSGTSAAENVADHFGFVAGRIAAFQVGTQKLAVTSQWKDSFVIGSTSDVTLQELAGNSRA